MGLSKMRQQFMYKGRVCGRHVWTNCHVFEFGVSRPLSALKSKIVWRSLTENMKGRLSKWMWLSREFLRTESPFSMWVLPRGIIGGREEVIAGRVRGNLWIVSKQYFEYFKDRYPGGAWFAAREGNMVVVADLKTRKILGGIVCLDKSAYDIPKTRSECREVEEAYRRLGCPLKEDSMRVKHPIRIQHFRFTCGGAATVAYRVFRNTDDLGVERLEARFGVGFCSPKDQFSRRRGRQIALSRLCDGEQSVFWLPGFVPKDEGFNFGWEILAWILHEKEAGFGLKVPDWFNGELTEQKWGKFPPLSELVGTCHRVSEKAFKSVIAMREKADAQPRESSNGG